MTDNKFYNGSFIQDLFKKKYPSYLQHAVRACKFSLRVRENLHARFLQVLYFHL